MSRETSTWLNQNVLIGFAQNRGHAWHYRASDQGDEPNHYDDAVPVADVERRLFNWEPVATPLLIRVPSGVDNADGMDEEGDPFRYVEVPNQQAITRSDTHAVLGIFKDSYQPHDYSDVLLRNVENLIDDELGISSAGLLKGGAVGWVEISVPETLTADGGVQYRPNILACTSLDGSLATTYGRTITAVVCDNTLSAALGEAGQKYKIKHSKYSNLKIADAREALQIVYATGDAFAADVAELLSRKVTADQFQVVLKEIIQDPKNDTKAGATSVENRREKVSALYKSDARCAPWTGTAFGVLQAFNTYAHHEQTVRGGNRAERNMLNALDGTTQKADAAVMAALVKAGC